MLTVSGVTRFGCRQLWASPVMGIASLGRRQLVASTGLGVAHLEGVTRCPKSVLWPRWCRHPIPTSRSDRGGGGREGGSTLGACRPRASVCQKVNIAEKDGFKATPSVPVRRAPIHDLSAHEV